MISRNKLAVVRQLGPEAMGSWGPAPLTPACQEAEGRYATLYVCTGSTAESVLPKVEVPYSCTEVTERVFGIQYS